MPELAIRLAVEADRNPVMEISASVWDGHDYLPQVWDSWVSEPTDQGFLLVGELGGRVVGVQHTSFQGDGVAWMEGIRIHPRFRNQGLGGLMLERAVEMSRDSGCSKARLSTGQVNEASARVATGHGFDQVGVFHIFRSTPVAGETPNVEHVPVTVTDLDSLRETLGLRDRMIVNQWTAYDLPGQVMPGAFPHHRLRRHAGSVDGIGLASGSRGGDELSIAFLAGTVDAVESLGRAFRNTAAEFGMQGVFAMLPEREEITHGLASAGFERDEHLDVLVFELNLVGSMHS